MKVEAGRAVVAGMVGTLAMTAVGLWVAPVMGIPRMNPAAVLHFDRAMQPDGLPPETGVHGINATSNAIALRSPGSPAR